MLKQILKLEDEPRLLVRQMIIPSGRLDLLFAYQTELLLLELKVVAFQRRFLGQILSYRDDLVGYQSGGRLLKGTIRPYLLCTASNTAQKQMASATGVTCVDYAPEQLLQYFYQNLEPIARFTEVKPVDLGIWNLHLIHNFIYFLEETTRVDRLRSLVGGSQKTLYNKIKFASELRLINWVPGGNRISLTELGQTYVRQKDLALPERLSEAQIDLLKELVARNPYESPVILGIASIVEAAFILSKNTYPIPLEHLIECFSYFAGKYFDWRTEKAKYNATRMYSNYAVDLGLLAKSSDAVYLTPDGFRFTLQLQLHKSLKMVNVI